MLSVSTLQSIQSLLKKQINLNHLVQQSYKDCRSYHSSNGDAARAEKYHRMYQCEVEKLAKFVATQKEIKKALEEMYYLDTLDELTMWEDV